MLTNNLINLDIVNLMSIISDNASLILIHFTTVVGIAIPTILMSKRSDKILKALQLGASSTIVGRGGIDGYNYLKNKFSGSEDAQPSGSDSSNPSDNNKPSGSDNNKPSGGDSNKPAPTDGSKNTSGK